MTEKIIMYGDSKTKLDRLVDAENWGGAISRIEKAKMLLVVALLIGGSLILG